MDKVLMVALMAAIVYTTAEGEDDLSDREWSAKAAIALYEEVVKQLEAKLKEVKA